ncbi:MAG: putative glycoside hydrolase [Desulfosarcinaceae bacterium]|nr:putative glycoside hydrolase [Desulfosarcinaceae bacterium]
MQSSSPARHRWLEVLLLPLFAILVAASAHAAPLDGPLHPEVFRQVRPLPGPMATHIGAADRRAAATPAEPASAAMIRAIYLPPSALTDRRIADLLHHADQLPVNGVVMHVKDPFGRLRWRSAAALANANGSDRQTRHLIHTVKRLKAKGIWTIAKLDLFADHGLVAHHPAMGLIHVETLESWQDKNGLFWANPYDERVWDYYITLASELAGLGFDEVQFDYVRFPSDGELAMIRYPLIQPGLTRAACIGRFLEKAYAALKPTGVTLSADIFGLTAWKTDDFGVGQILEAMAPHLDVICPMLYPSHFPRGFLGKKTPGDYPREIMARSMANIQRRTDRIVRPWVQGFWYTPNQIGAQFDGIEAEAPATWTVWSPTGSYGLTYQALAARGGIELTRPVFYPSLAEMRGHRDRVTAGRHTVVNYTNFREGYSVLSLEVSRSGYRSPYTTPTAMLATLDEGIMDHILRSRGIDFGRMTGRGTKAAHLARLFCADLNLDPRRLRPAPYLIDWENGCRFSAELGQARRQRYASVVAAAMSGEPDTYLSLLEPPQRNLWRDLQ